MCNMFLKEDGLVVNMIVNVVCIKSLLKKKWVLVIVVVLRWGILVVFRSFYMFIVLVYVFKWFVEWKDGFGIKYICII